MEIRSIIEDVLKNLPTALGLTSLVDETIKILQSKRSDDEIQEPLLNLLGFEVLESDILPLLFTIRHDIQVVSNIQAQQQPQVTLPKQESGKQMKETQIEAADKPERQTATQVSSSLFDFCFVPHSKQRPVVQDLIPVSSLPKYFQIVFSEFTHFNAMQSQVYTTAFSQNVNLLVSAPTSAGKTNVALLCILRMVQQYLESNNLTEAYQRWIDYSSTHKAQNNKKQQQPKPKLQLTCKNECQKQPSEKILIEQPQEEVEIDLEHPCDVLKNCNYLCVYLTPMKALATEITNKFKTALQKLGLRVLECTGDESPPQELINNANVLILTPEKYDVITRKINTEEPLYLRQQLLIIDEIHLLGVPQRGPVLETIVCRAKQYIEQLQSPIRMVGISATIPNYTDLQRFLSVPSSGLFVFGDEYRPVPMSQFIFGVKEIRGKDLEDSKKLQKMKLDDQAEVLAGNYHHFADVVESCKLCEEEMLGKYVFKNNQKPVRYENKREQEKQEKKLGRNLEKEDILDSIAIQMCVQNYKNNHPTLLFVHSRRKTVELAKMIATLVPRLDYCNEKAVVQAQDCEKGQLSFCIQNGIGFHNAQLEKKHRQLVENLFKQGEILIVVCTATLAWGVNLPSQTVIIRGTDIFTDTGKQDLDVLDVKQIFGRAGRPQFTGKGEIGRGIILTTIDKLGSYMRLLNNESQIDSHMGSMLPDVLNSEIVLGNISTVQNALDYIKRTFYYIRITNTDDMVIWALAKLQQAKLIYCDKSMANNPNLTITPTELGKICSYYYIDYNTLNEFLSSLKQSPIGNALQHEDLMHFLSSVPQFNNLIPRGDERQELMSISGTAMQQIDQLVQQGIDQKKSAKQLNYLINSELFKQKSVCHLNILGKDDEASYKTNILIQAFISRYECKTASLCSDQRMTIQQIGRIAQALFEALLTFKRFEEALKMHDIVNSILYQSWYEQQSPLLSFVQVPLGQTKSGGNNFTIQLYSSEKSCTLIQKTTISKFNSYFNLEKIQNYEQFMNISYEDMKTSIGQENARQIQEARKYIPQLSFDVFIVPVSAKVLRIQFNGIPQFIFNKKIHNYEQEFLIAFSRADNGLLIHYEKVTVTEETMRDSIDITVLIKVNQWQNIKIGKQQVQYSKYLSQLQIDGDEDTLEGADQTVPVLKATVVPLNWTGSKLVRQSRLIDLKNIIIQEADQLRYKQFNQNQITFQNKDQTYFTPLPKTKPLSIKALHFQEAEQLFKFAFFNPLQTVMFHYLYYKTQNIFIGAPTSCGKTVAAEIAVLNILKNNSNLKCVYIAPLKALVRERFDDWRLRFAKLGVKVIEMTGETLPDAKSLLESQIYVATPEKFDAVSRSLKDKDFLKTIGLIIFDEVHLIGTQRGYVLESIVSRFLQMSKQTRFIGLSTASSNVRDISRWLNVQPQFIFNFDSNARPVRLETHIQGYIGEAYCPRMELMNKPVYSAIKKYAPNLPVLIFVSSRRQTRKTGYSLLNQAQQDSQAPECFWRIPREDIAEDIEDEDAKNLLKYGIGIHHAAMGISDRNTIQNLFTGGQITVLVCTATLAWGINVPAYMTILKGCEYFDKAQERYVEFDISEVNQMCGRAGRPQFIQKRYEQWVQEYFGKQTLELLKSKGAFEAMYKFDSKKLLSYLANKNDKDVIDIFAQLQERDKETPQAVSLIMCKQSMKEFYKQFINEPLPMESSLLNSTFGNALSAALLKVKQLEISHFPDLINAEIVAAKNLTLISLRNWLQLTFFFQRARRNPVLYGIDVSEIQQLLEEISSEQLNELQVEFAMYSNGMKIIEQQRHILMDFFTVLRIYSILDQQIQVLLNNKLIQIENPEDNPLKYIFIPTDIGDLSSRYYLCYLTIPHFIQNFYSQKNENFLVALASCPEFREIPVRQTEDKEMAQMVLNGLLKYPGVKEIKDYNDVKVKTYILLQVQLRKANSPVVLPNTDYQLDLYAILDNALRIISAVTEIGLTTKQNISKVLEVIQCSQQIVQGFTSNIDQIQTLSQEKIKFLKQNKIFTFKELVASYHQNPSLLQEFEFLKQFPNLKFKIFAKLSEQKKQQVLELQIEFKHNSFVKISPTNFKNTVYPKQKPHTYYCFAGVETVQAFKKLPCMPNGGDCKLESIEVIPGIKEYRVVVQSDLFVGLGLDCWIDISQVGSEWLQVYDSNTMSNMQKKSNSNDIVITID
ncbi:RNA_helicase [Hexamita inflata]|uniref:RNA helicase n=1 Tax=Hexamita inflata TaxID=28002 RepID=A0AA86UQ84_9EUKA|nr:RNA helicase [Hexamita inflata]